MENKLLYVEQVEGFEQGDLNEWIYLLLKVLYGLKAAPTVVGMDAPSECATIMRKRDMQREPQTTKLNTILSQW
jgi:hypothetical protein